MVAPRPPIHILVERREARSEEVRRGLGSTSCALAPHVLLEVAAPVRPAAVGVGEAVLLARAATCSAPARSSRRRPGPRQRRHRPADVGRRLRRDEVRVLRRRVAPVRLGHAEVVEHRLRAQEARASARPPSRRAGAGPRPSRGEPDDRGLHEVVEEVAAVVGGVAVGDLDDQPLPALDHQRRGVVAGDDVRVDGALAASAARSPSECSQNGLPQTGERVAAPDVVDQQVQPALLAPDALDERRDLLRHGVVDLHGDADARRPRVTSSAVSSIVSGRSPVAGSPRTLRPVQ